jgi:hypothetical protein
MRTHVRPHHPFVIQHSHQAGEVEAFEIDDLELGELRELEREVAQILAAQDVALLAESMENGSAAGAIVWENRWAVPFASAAPQI